QRAFGHFELTDGRSTLGADLGGGVLLSHQLADSLDAKTGDHLRVTAELSGMSHAGSFTVAGIAKSVGPGAYGLRDTIFAPLDVVQRLVGTDQINIIRISGDGGLRSGVDSARAAEPAVRAALPPVQVPLEIRPEGARRG